MRQEFPRKIKMAAWERARGRCERCTASLASGNVEYDHRLPVALGGGSGLENCEVSCKTCHRAKTSTTDVPRIAKADRQKAAHIKAKRRKGQPMDGTKASRYRKRMDGRVERRS